MSVSASYSLASGAAASPAVDTGLPVEPVENLNHVAEALGRLIEEFKGLPRIEELLSIYVGQVQELEVAVFDLLTERTLDTAVGSQLDALGSIVGQERLGFSDDGFRTFIRARIKVNLSDGRADELLEILALISDPAEGTPSILHTEYPPAEFHIQVLSDIGTLDPALAFLLLTEAKPAGVRFLFIYSTEPAAEQFTLDDDTTLTLDSALGLGDTITPASGGKLTSVLS